MTAVYGAHSNNVRVIHRGRRYLARVCWFITSRLGYLYPAPLDDLFADLAAADAYALDYAAEHFSLDELQQLERWMLEFSGPELVSEAVCLPLPNKMIGFGDRCYTPRYEGLVELRCWELPFSIKGLYSLRYWDDDHGDFRFLEPLDRSDADETIQ